MTVDRPREQRTGGSRGRRLLAMIIFLVVVAAIIASAPRLGRVARALADVHWEWAVAAVLLNVISLLVRGLGWRALLAGALRERDAGAGIATRSYLVGQLANAVLAGRVGEASKIAVYTGHLANPAEDWGVVTGTVAAHRVLDTLPLGVLIFALTFYVDIPDWTLVVFSVSVLLLLVAVVVASRADRGRSTGRITRLIAALRSGLGVLRSPRPAAISLALQSAGWAVEVMGVWCAFRAFGIHADEAAGLVVVATNAAALLPIVPSNIGVFQVAVAGVLTPAGVPYGTGLVFGTGLQAIETLATVVAGVPAAVREGVSLRSLLRSPGTVGKSSPSEAA